MAQRDKTWESAWKSVFENKAVSPPEDAWDNISNELDKSRRRYMLPIWWAAATVSIIAVAGVLLTERIPADKHSAEEFQLEVEQNKEARPFANLAPDNSAVKPKNGDGNSVVGKDHIASAAKVGKKETPERMGSISSKSAGKNNEIYDFIPGLVDGIKAVASDLKLPEVGEIWGVPMAYNGNKKRKTSNWYAGLDLSTGSSSVAADGSASANDMMPLTNSFSQADKASSDITSTNNASSSRSYGITVGKKFTNRLVLESGISYLRLSNSGTTNIAIASAAGREAFNYNAIRSEANVMTTNAPYAVENVHQFISIPLKAGYIFLDRQWKLSVSSGIAGDYFIKTHTADLSGDLQMYEANPSTDPLWNSVTMSVLGEMNVSRQLGPHYLLAITPQMRKSLNDLSNTRTELRPFVFQLGIQIKYQF